MTEVSFMFLSPARGEAKERGQSVRFRLSRPLPLAEERSLNAKILARRLHLR